MVLTAIVLINTSDPVAINNPILIIPKNPKILDDVAPSIANLKTPPKKSKINGLIYSICSPLMQMYKAYILLNML